MTNKAQDRSLLAKTQYKTADNLNARWDLYKYCVPTIDIYEKALEDLKLNGDENILEAGCGDGSVLLSLRERLHHQGQLTGLEINNTIVQPTKDYLSANPALEAINFIVGSADKLPFKDNSFSIILAFFMLYHLDDIPNTLAEWSRVLGSRGKLLVSTSSSHSRPKGKSIKQQMANTAGVKLPQAKFSEPFNLENGQEQLEQTFKVVNRFVYDGEIRITDPELYLRSFDSTRDMYVPIPNDIDWAKARNFAKNTIQEEIDQKGYFSDTVKRGYFICEQVFLDSNQVN